MSKAVLDMDQWLTAIAEQAIAELQLPCHVWSVSGIPDRDEWCIQFTDEYKGICESFHDENGLRYSDDLLLEIIKSHLLAQQEAISASLDISNRLFEFLSSLSQKRGRAWYRPASSELEDVRSFQAEVDEIRRLKERGVLTIVGEPHRESRTGNRYIDLIQVEMSDKGVKLLSERRSRTFDKSAALESTASSQGSEIAHVLFMDIVGYSKLPTDQQPQILHRLNKIVRATQEFRHKQAKGQLISLATGDGMALVFFGDPEAHVKCAVELSRALRSRPEIKLRMGINSGLVYRLSDISGKPNVAGVGINMAQRVMDCGDAGHILISRTVAEFLGDLSNWSKYIHDLGEAEVKHGAKVYIFNLFSSDFGNPELPEKFRTKHSQAASASSAIPQVQRTSKPQIPAAAQVEPRQSYSGSLQEQRAIAQQIITALYEAWSKHTIISLNPVQEQGGWDKGIFRTVVDKLEKQRGLIKNYGSSYTFEITSTGILYAEENQIVPRDIATWHAQVRKHILAFLADLRDREGNRAHVHYEKIADGAPVKDRLEILIDLSLLTDLGYVEAASTSSFRITDEGMRYFSGSDYEDII